MTAPVLRLLLKLNRKAKLSREGTKSRQNGKQCVAERARERLLKEMRKRDCWLMREREIEGCLSEYTQSLRAGGCERQTDRQMAGWIALLD